MECHLRNKLFEVFVLNNFPDNSISFESAASKLGLCARDVVKWKLQYLQAFLQKGMWRYNPPRNYSSSSPMSSKLISLVLAKPSKYSSCS